MKIWVRKHQKLPECWCCSLWVSKTTSKKTGCNSTTCKRNWVIDCKEPEAALMESFPQMGVNSWERKTAGRNSRDPRAWDKLLTKVIGTAEKKRRICSSFKEKRQLLTTLVQRTGLLPRKGKGYEPWNVYGVSKTDPLLSAARAGNFATAGSSANTGWAHAGPARPQGRDPPPPAGLLCSHKALLVVLGRAGNWWDPHWDRAGTRGGRKGGGSAPPMAWFARSWSGRLLFSCVRRVMLSIFELIFDAEQVHLLSANGSISFIVTLFSSFQTCSAKRAQR